MSELPMADCDNCGWMALKDGDGGRVHELQCLWSQNQDNARRSDGNV
jgi:hypothetical protein